MGVDTEIREEKPYFGNVAVDIAVRRQGIGEKLVKIGMKVPTFMRLCFLSFHLQLFSQNPYFHYGLKLIESKWRDDCVFVAVDCNNGPAREMYEKLGFQVFIFSLSVFARSH